MKKKKRRRRNMTTKKLPDVFNGNDSNPHTNYQIIIKEKKNVVEYVIVGIYAMQDECNINQSN